MPRTLAKSTICLREFDGFRFALPILRAENCMSFLRRFVSDLQAGIVATVTVLRGLWRGNLDEIRGQLNEINRKALSHRRDILFRGIGAALSAWSKMEEIMVVIAMQLLRTSPEKAGVVMYSIINFNTWLSLIHYLFEHDDDFQNFKGRFDKIGERIRRIKDQRDQLAHHSVCMPRNVL
jgi:hypothetical protein